MSQFDKSGFMSQTWRFSDRFMKIQNSALRVRYKVSSFFYNQASRFLRIAPLLYITYLMFANDFERVGQLIIVIGLWILGWILENLLNRFFVTMVYDFNPNGIIRSTVLGAVIMLLLSVLFLIVIF